MQNKASVIMRYIASVLCTMEYGTPLPPLPEGIGWSEVYELASKHSLASSIWYFIADEVRSVADASLVVKWEKETGMDFVKNTVQQSEFKTITDLLIKNEIRFLPMKGFLFKEIWKCPEYRTMADMDFYVDEEDLPRVGQLLEKIGYEKDHDDERHDTFTKAPYVHVEMHRALEDGIVADFERWEKKQGSQYWYVMGREDFIVFNIAHMYKHYIKGGCGARSLFDMHLYLKRFADFVDEERLALLLSEAGLSEFYTDICALMRLWFENGTQSCDKNNSLHCKDAEPTEKLLEFEYFISTGGAYGSIENKVIYTSKGKSKSKYVLSRLFPPLSVMRTIYKWLDKAPILLPFAYLVRCFGAVFNKRARAELRAVNKTYASK